MQDGRSPRAARPTLLGSGPGARDNVCILLQSGSLLPTGAPICASC
ncbi:hypothetical protein D8I24_5381 [Cupriavidus necator H850]|nr:hypothetical protein D8I24_5381 [Cupriavidus necator H850]